MFPLPLPPKSPASQYQIKLTKVVLFVYRRKCMHIDRRGPLDLSETKAAEPNHGPIL